MYSILEKFILDKDYKYIFIASLDKYIYKYIFIIIVINICL